MPVVRRILQSYDVFAFCSLILLDSVPPQHIHFTWVAHHNRMTDTLTGIMLLLLVINVYNLYYGPGGWDDLAKTTHLMMGIAAVTVVPLHMLIGRGRHGGYHAPTSRSAWH